MESDTFYGDFIVKVIWRWSGYLIIHVFSIKPQIISRLIYYKISINVSLHTVSILTILVTRFTKFSPIKTFDKLHNFSILWRKHIFPQ